MSHDRLETILKQLHDEMESGQLDEQDRELLRVALADVALHLEEHGDLPEDPQENLRAAYARFKAEHPMLAGGIERVMHLLSQSGI